MTTPETPIETSITQLEEHMTPSQNADLVQILEVGEELKKRGQELGEYWWKRNSWEVFRNRCEKYGTLFEQRKELYSNELDSISYNSRSSQLKQKFQDEFLFEYVIYDTNCIASPSSIDDLVVGYNVIMGEFEKTGRLPAQMILKDEHISKNKFKNLINILTAQWWIGWWMRLVLSKTPIYNSWIELLAKMIEATWWLWRGSKLGLEMCEFGDEWLKSLCDAIANTWWLREWVGISALGNDFSPEWMINFNTLLWPTRWISKGGILEIGWEHLDDKWIKIFCDAVVNSGGIKEWVYLNLQESSFGSKWAQEIVSMFERTWWYKTGVFLKLYGTKIWNKWIECIVDYFEKIGWIPVLSGVSLNWCADNLTPKLNDRITRLNNMRKGQILV